MHDALVQYVMCEFNLFIKKEDFKQHLDDLRTNKTPDSNTTGMDIEFGVSIAVVIWTRKV